MQRALAEFCRTHTSFSVCGGKKNDPPHCHFNVFLKRNKNRWSPPKVTAIAQRFGLLTGTVCAPFLIVIAMRIDPTNCYNVSQCFVKK